ncbi:MAG TPA: hypothetical protein PKZ42_05115 [Syntrophales bacterium]|nr:hypothetical protein [Syntrophales bacterium]
MPRMRGEKSEKDVIGSCRIARVLPGLLEFKLILCYLRLIKTGGLPVYTRAILVYM